MKRRLLLFGTNRANSRVPDAALILLLNATATHAMTAAHAIASPGGTPPSPRVAFARNACSQPVTCSDDMADYVPTQILAEVFRNAGYDVIGYASQFREKYLNIVLFNPDDSDVIHCAPYKVTGLEVSFKEIGNR